jgi:hypothetical protein
MPAARASTVHCSFLKLGWKGLHAYVKGGGMTYYQSQLIRRARAGAFAVARDGDTGGCNLCGDIGGSDWEHAMECVAVHGSGNVKAYIQIGLLNAAAKRYANDTNEIIKMCNKAKEAMLPGAGGGTGRKEPLAVARGKVAATCYTLEAARTGVGTVATGLVKRGWLWGRVDAAPLTDAQERLPILTGVLPGLHMRRGDGYVACAVAAAAAKRVAAYVKAERDNGKEDEACGGGDAPT